VVGLNLVGQPLRGLGTQVLRHKVHMQRQHVASLRVAALAPGAGIVDFTKG
jgi:hypothetical protein